MKSHTPSCRLLAAWLCLGFLVSAADSAADETITPPNCTKPALPVAQKDANAAERDRQNKALNEFQKSFDSWRDCMKSYIDAQSELSKKHVEAANASVREVNDYVTEINKLNSQNTAK